ncbi:HAMP domain-containing histidine kinase [Geobacter pelophilus]|uniref:histidine kinase n=1 Tax=Geoanaerobacter pelophilus TaxID=60036 RepID=A0AAW4KZP2_9BACT|nr:HAMP domain-containing sensor histidine kinase [Geoanaerobacter pelophilus]MBT0664048.1 HAMP domain-containing histidine kinase [Geoanaerobacter pelophilus]
MTKGQNGAKTPSPEQFAYVRSISDIFALYILISAVILAAGAWYLTTREIRTALQKGAVSEAERTAFAILGATRSHMLKNDQVLVHQVIEEIGLQGSGGPVRVLAKNGRVISSSVSDSENNTIRAAECALCHEKGSSSVKDAGFRIEKTGKERILTYARIIPNSPQCTESCHYHKKEQRALGILTTQIPLVAMDAVYANLVDNVWMLAFIWGSLSCGITFWALRRFVSGPLNSLSEKAQAMAAGSLDERVGITKIREFDAAGYEFNQMAAALQKSQESLRDINASLEDEVEKRTGELLAARVLLERSERLASLGTLAAGIAHEINNPLTGIMLHTSLAMGETSEQGKADLERVSSEAQRCATIARRLLEFSRSDEPRTAPLSLSKVLAESVELARAHEAVKHVTVVLPESDATIVADQQQMIQVLVNILINAGQAMSGNGTIRGTIITNGDTATLQIADEGKGMTEEELARAFDPFYTTKENGTGLGLAVTYGIVEGHGGSITLASTPGEGTTVSINLPLAHHTENMF